MSQKNRIRSGVRQGSISEPIMFVQFINDLPLRSCCSLCEMKQHLTNPKTFIFIFGYDVAGKEMMKIKFLSAIFYVSKSCSMIMVTFSLKQSFKKFVSLTS
jgi:hypothetical protein